jgi:hypothetical protein
MFSPNQMACISVRPTAVSRDPFFTKTLQNAIQLSAWCAGTPAEYHE